MRIALGESMRDKKQSVEAIIWPIINQLNIGTMAKSYIVSKLVLTMEQFASQERAEQGAKLDSLELIVKHLKELGIMKWVILEHESKFGPLAAAAIERGE